MKKLDASFFNNHKTITNLSNSFLSHYGLNPFHAPIEEVLNAIKGRRKIAVFLFDGLGKAILEAYPKEARYILEHSFLDIYSTNPATTVASTTSFLTAKTPIETGYLGWTVQFKDYSFPIEAFSNRNALTGEEVASFNLMEKRCPTKKIDVLLREKGIKASCLFPFPIAKNGPRNFEDIYLEASSFFNDGGEFLYIYVPEPDHTLHEEGVISKKVASLIIEENALIEHFVNRHPDVLVFSLSDHGMVDIEYQDIAKEKDIVESLAKPISLEGRTTSFFIKEDKKEIFQKAFLKRFPNFTLLTKEEVIQSKYFGEGEASSYSLDFIGDFVSISLGNDFLFDSRYKRDNLYFKGHHAGGKKEEREILLSLYNRNY